MTVEIDLERVAAVVTRLRRHQATAAAVREHLVGVGRRLHLDAEVAPAVALADVLADRLALAAALLAQRAERAERSDAGTELRSFAGGTALCAAIQLASPIPSRPSTSGVAGAIDAVGVARDATALVEAAATGPTLAGRAAPLASLLAATLDLVLCRLRVGSGAAISTTKIVDEHGDEVYEGSRSTNKHQTDSGEPLDSDLERRDRQMWRVEHSNQLGYLMQPYPGYPAYAVNAPRSRE